MTDRTSVAIIASLALSVAGCVDPDYVHYRTPPPPAVVRPAVVQPTIVQPVSTRYVQPVYVYPEGGHSGSIRPPRRRHDDGYRRDGSHKGHGKASPGPKVPDYAIRNRMKAQQKAVRPVKSTQKGNSVSPTRVVPAQKTKAVPKKTATSTVKPSVPPKKNPPSKKNPPPKKK